MGRKLLDPVRDLPIRELIGSEIRILSHPDRGFIGLQGTILDETMGLFLIGTGEEKRRMPKKGAEIEVKVRREGDEIWVKVRCDQLVHRPEDRTKKLQRRTEKGSRALRRHSRKDQDK